MMLLLHRPADSEAVKHPLRWEQHRRFGEAAADAGEAADDTGGAAADAGEAAADSGEAAADTGEAAADTGGERKVAHPRPTTSNWHAVSECSLVTARCLLAKEHLGRWQGGGGGGGGQGWDGCWLLPSLGHQLLPSLPQAAACWFQGGCRVGCPVQGAG